MIEKYRKKINGTVGNALAYTDVVLGWFAGDHAVRDIFDYRSVIKPRPDLYVNGAVNVKGGLSYKPSFNYSLRKYSNTRGGVCYVCEHGSFFHNYDPTLEDYKSPYPVILVDSDERRMVLKQHTKKCVITIGPDTHYAPPIFDANTIEIMKNTLGKTLLVFPMHNTAKEAYVSDREKFVKYVNDIAKKHGYETIMVCLYHFNIEMGEDDYYLRQGWRVVSAGLPYNYDFKSILKTLILLSDGVINQSFSSNVGWAIYLGRPVTIYNQQSFEMIKDGRSIKYDTSYGSHYDENLDTILSEYSEEISPEQYDFFAYHYGYKNVRTPEQIAKILAFAREAYLRRLGHKGMLMLAQKERYESIRPVILEGLRLESKKG